MNFHAIISSVSKPCLLTQHIFSFVCKVSSNYSDYEKECYILLGGSYFTVCEGFDGVRIKSLEMTKSGAHNGRRKEIKCLVRLSKWETHGWVFLSQKHRIIKMLYLYSDFVFQVWKEKRDDVMGNCRSLPWEKSLSSMLRCLGKTAHINIIQENNVLILPLNIITHALLFQERLIVLPKRETCYYVLTYSFK